MASNGKAAKHSVLVINPNSTQSMTRGLETLLSSHSFPNLEFTFFTAPSGPSSINNEDDGAESTKHCIPELNEDVLRAHDGFIIACYSNHSLVNWIKERPGVRDSPKQVWGIFPASVVQSVQVIGQEQSYGIVSTGKYWEKALTEAIKGWDAPPDAFAKLQGVETTGLSATELHDLPQDLVHAKLTDATRRLVKGGNVGAVCMGCAGMAGMEETVREACVLELGRTQGEAVMIIDGVVAAAELIDHNLS